MLKRRLGRSNIKISALGLGCWAIGRPNLRTSEDGKISQMGWGKVDDFESLRAIHGALDLGALRTDDSHPRFQNRKTDQQKCSSNGIWSAFKRFDDPNRQVNELMICQF
jgi:hypothetical protein